MAVKELPKYESDRDDYIHVENTANFVQKIMKVENLPEEIAGDTETYYNSSLRAPQAISKWIKGARNNCPFGASFYTGTQGYWVTENLHELQPLLLAPVDWDFHNVKYDKNMLLNIGLKLTEQRVWDTAIMINLIDEEFMCKIPTPEGEPQKYKRSKALKNLAFHFLGATAHKYEDAVAEYRKVMAANQGAKLEDISYRDVNIANPLLMKDYAIADTEYCWKLKKIFHPMLAQQNLFEAYQIDINATWAVLDIERAGYMVDQYRLNEDAKALENIINTERAIIYKIAGSQFEINSSAELVAIFEKLGQKWEWYTDKEELCTDKSIMKLLIKTGSAPVSQLAEEVLKYRGASKIYSTYVIGVRDYIQEDGKIHADFWINPSDYDKNGTKTGRLSSSNPNMQNFKKKPVEFSLDEKSEDEY